MDLDLCNDCHQSVGIPCTLVYLLNVNEVSYLVGKPFYSTFLFIWEVVFACVRNQWRCSSVQYYGRILYSFLMLQACKISSDMWLHSADVRKQTQRRKVCSAGAGSPAGWGTPVTATATTAPDDHRADVPNADSGGSSHQSDFGRYSAAAAVASAPTSAQMPQMPRDKRAEFMRGHPPVFAHSSDPMDAEDWLHNMERELHTAQCDDREKVL
jgi:hypothetical protein